MLLGSPKDPDSLKRTLNIISEIFNQSMVMEFRIADVMEKFRTLKIYKQSVEEETMHEALNLDKNWKDLEKSAKRKEH